ncbi:MAG: hypothetical protein A2711_09725 [Burkholderiales bacterium RIFCSPHIGHO2_01_FULL_63_240]|nr:MAG: hypothetical protein A2711_09725 [Burkholderiales bacterium RIFCSPHIGHO2_01_FULL_63_240]
MKPEDVDVCRELAESYISAHGGGVIDALLGDGGSAAVFRWNLGSTIKALKVYDPKFLSGPAAPAERSRLGLQRRFIGTHCASLIDTLAVEEERGTCFVEMEFFPGKELKRVLAEVPDDAIAPLIGQLVSAVQFLDSLGIVHRDIKPENVLVSADFTQMKLLDLGIIREITEAEDRPDATDHGQRRPFIATAQYSSPEYLFRLEAPSPALWRALSIYQVGGVLHDLVCRRPLFERAVAADNKYALAMAVMREPPDFAGVPAHLSTWAALAARCLAKDSRVRLHSVEWSDFHVATESVADRLRRVLSGRAARAVQAEEVLAEAVTLGRQRAAALNELVDGVRRQLLADFSPQLRVALSAGDEHRSILRLTLDACVLDVLVALECRWEEGIRESTGVLSLAAVSVQRQGEGPPEIFSGARRFVGELSVGCASKPLSTGIIESVSQLAVKHAELVDASIATAGLDLVASCWPQA